MNNTMKKPQIRPEQIFHKIGGKLVSVLYNACIRDAKKKRGEKDD